MSTINTGSIDVNYPVPGVNNNSQGFRDNFSGIKSNLDIASSEITDLQNKVVLKSALTDSNLNNDMANTLISNALTQGFRQVTFNLGNNLNGVTVIDCTKGDLQYGTLTGSINLEFSKWPPAGTYSSVEVYLTVSSASYNISLPASVNVGVTTIENCTTTGSGGVIRILGSQGPDTPSILHLRFTTIDCGTSIEVIPMNRPRVATQIITKVPTSSKGAVGDRAGLVAVDTNFIYVCTGVYNGSTDIWKRSSLTGGSW